MLYQLQGAIVIFTMISSSTGITFSLPSLSSSMLSLHFKEKSSKNKTRTQGRCSIKESELLIFHGEFFLFLFDWYMWWGMTKTVPSDIHGFLGIPQYVIILFESKKQNGRSGGGRSLVEDGFGRRPSFCPFTYFIWVSYVHLNHSWTIWYIIQVFHRYTTYQKNRETIFKIVNIRKCFRFAQFKNYIG